MLNLQRLTVFSAVMRTGSIRDAARELEYTAAAISQQISTFEREVGLELFERTARSVRPTTAARQIEEWVNSVIARAGHVEREIDGVARGLSGRLRVGAFPTAVATLLPEAIARLQRLRPAASLDLSEAEPSEVTRQVRSGELDVGLTFAYRPVPHAAPSDLTRHRLLVEPLSLLMSPDSVTHESLPVSAETLLSLRARDFVASREGTAGAECLERLCALAGFAPAVQLRSNDYAVVAGYAAAGLGVAIVPALAMVQPHPRVDVRRLDLPGALRETFVLTRPGARPPLMVAFMQALNSAARDITRRPDLQSLGLSHDTVPVVRHV